MTPETQTRLVIELKADEGEILRVYKDHLGNLTWGVGHLVEEGDVIVPEQSMISLGLDVEQTVEDCRAVYDDFDAMADELQLIVANMMFNLGRTRYLRFTNHIAAVRERDHIRAADEMEFEKPPGGKNSDWYLQVGKRAKRLVRRMRELAL